jgi:hypothetical protein
VDRTCLIFCIGYVQDDFTTRRPKFVQVWHLNWSLFESELPRLQINTAAVAKLCKLMSYLNRCSRNCSRVWEFQVQPNNGSIDSCIVWSSLKVKSRPCLFYGKWFKKRTRLGFWRKLKYMPEGNFRFQLPEMNFACAIFETSSINTFGKKSNLRLV